jgi:hypothetical protein
LFEKDNFEKFSSESAIRFCASPLLLQPFFPSPSLSLSLQHPSNSRTPLQVIREGLYKVFLRFLATDSSPQSPYQTREAAARMIKNYQLFLELIAEVSEMQAHRKEQRSTSLVIETQLS